MIVAGLLASLGLSAFYYLVLFLLSQDPFYPLQQFLSLWPWMSLLIIGFGVQWSIFVKLRQGKMMVGGTSAISGTAMVACCAHHVSDLLPFLGLAGAAIFLVNYQKELLIVGIVSNLAGVGFMAWRLWRQSQI
ncbi:MAG: hypothetical protein UX85_C0010G0015 [Candidatus Beckwithbacteria bacterium GW2011_GWB1_47_15]|uniref:Uncharacterized protein n=1 Tax=Candidatus Beckwithbacteria bacterium GW2011_GWB1_47_15 TaxID=1618371 RepID=A0A0G1RTJ2_9BACT|nr:MAG: hypothetical protein UY43_C0001G0819 [Candidatus Beckwithbacteria bacterium GW2011_GWC1_49_16]AQS30944.1 hypothetical protein [uncultured bacterium]KKU34888.1 MAG: hypothetical protein UX50_C0009G0015 [Candidatus Beckwithbacteria bacterium GW2011_GWA1_46_30]KKU60482.1 MAG: hypothetical protein UX85_C0010G0015 [Candidatus Beckwithbacteria bacterium GW2011_GWB1_47_15]KKU72357.1 MAG: hypothetical protein UX97_C0001G0227 [Candidatus Beckwithbacteria bacterium GW2011_GWA2_47_25]OGD48249.1 M